MPSSANCSIEYQQNCQEHIGELITYMGVLTPVSSLGIVLNSLLLAVLFHRSFKTHGLAIFTILRCIALMDLLVCVALFPIGFCRCIATDVYWELYAQAIYEVYIYFPMSNFFGTASLFLTVEMCLDISIGIQFPVRAKKWCTCKNVRRIFYAILVVAFAINAPLYFYHVIETDPEPSIDYSPWGYSSGAGVYMWIRLVFVKFLPTFLIILVAGFLTCSIVRAFYGPRKTSMNFNYKMRIQQNICWMVVCIATLVALAHSLEPIAHTEIYAALFGECKVFDKTHRTLRLVSTVLEAISYACKLPVYLAFHPQFLTTLRIIVCCQDNKVHGEYEDSMRSTTSHACGSMVQGNGEGGSTNETRPTADSSAPEACVGKEKKNSVDQASKS